MAAEIGDWISLTALATSLFALVEAKKANRTGETVQALTHVIDASERTQTYLALRAEGSDRSRQTEHEIAELWSRAAFLISRIDQSLAVRLDAKSRFWRNPDTWSPTLRASKQISLSSVTTEARRLMAAYA